MILNMINEKKEMLFASISGIIRKSVIKRK